MTNELKPCPFCGGEAKLYHEDTNCDYVRNNYYPVVTCTACGCRTIDDINQTDDNLAIQEWNTRQPAFDWKPIEELTEDEFLDGSDFLFYRDKGTNDRYHVGVRVSYEKVNGGTDELIWLPNDSVFFESIICMGYTHYTLLTPPQTNQS